MNKKLASVPAGAEFGMDIRKVIAEGNHVWIWVTVKGNGAEKESINIIVFEDGQIRRKWDVGQVGRHPETEGLL